MVWRQEGITATDIPILLGSNTYQTLQDLIETKKGKETPVTYAMTHGKMNEPYVRDALRSLTGIKFEPACVQNVQHPKFRASLDAVSFQHSLLYEIKCPISKAILASVAEGEFPLYWEHQVQWQLLVTGFKEGIIAVQEPRSSFTHFKLITQDTDLQQEMISKANEFLTLLEESAPKP